MFALENKVCVPDGETSVNWMLATPTVPVSMLICISGTPGALVTSIDGVRTLADVSDGSVPVAWTSPRATRSAQFAQQARIGAVH